MSAAAGEIRCSKFPGCNSNSQAPLIIHEPSFQSDCWVWVMRVGFDTQWNTLYGFFFIWLEGRIHVVCMGLDLQSSVRWRGDGKWEITALSKEWMKENFHPWVKVDQANRPLPPKTLCILEGLALKTGISVQWKFASLYTSGRFSLFLVIMIVFQAWKSLFW